MATATATMPLHPFNEESDHDVGMSISPAPSPHTTLTPIEAATLSAQTKEAVNGNTTEQVPGGGEASTSHSTGDKDSFLTPNSSLNMSVVVSQRDVNANDDLTELTKEQKMEARIAQLEQSLASLTEVCNGLVKQQQVRNTLIEDQIKEMVEKLVRKKMKRLSCQDYQDRSLSETPSPPHRRFDSEIEALSQWPPSQKPILDSPEVSTRRRRHRSSSFKDDNEHKSKPSKTMSMLLLDIAPGESRGPSMIPFTEDLDEGGDSGGEKSSRSSESCQNADNNMNLFEAPPMLKEETTSRGTSPARDSSATTTPGTSSNESSPRQQVTRLHSSLKVVAAQENNLECQAYTSTHLEALRLRREAGKVRAYSFNDTLAKTPEAKYRKHLENRSASKTDAKLPTISSPAQNTSMFNVLKLDGTHKKGTESADTFVQVLSPEIDNENHQLNVPILSPAHNVCDEKESVSVLPRKDSIASHSSAKCNREEENQSTTETTSRSPPKGKEGSSNNSLSLLNNIDNNTQQECFRSTVSVKDDTTSIASTSLTVKSNNTVKSAEKKPPQDDAKNKQSMKNYIINDLLNIDSRHQDGSATEDIDANMEEFLRIPFKLEHLMWFSLAVCTDSFLYVWTLLPLKAVWGFVCLLCTIARPGKGIKGIVFHRRHLYALLQCLLVWFVFYHVLRPISIGKLYHWIRGQAMLKLYVLIAIVEVFDRLLCSFGQDAWDSLYWNTTRRPRHPRMLVSMIVVGVYVTIHSLFLFVHVATLSVAVNSADNALLTLLISGNFAEIKSTVFKKYNKQNLFKITTSDICERFKLALFLLLILLLNCFQGEMSRNMVKEYYTMCLIVMVAELISDWIKHSFITKFNSIKSTAYFDYALILSGDVTGIGHEGLNLDYTHAAVKRTGLAQIPLVCVTARYLHEALRFTIAFKGNGDVEHPMNAMSEFFDVPRWKFYSGIFVFMVALVGLKIGLGGGIRLIARHYLGGDVIELLEKKSKKSSTPKITSGRAEKNDAKKNQ